MDAASTSSVADRLSLVYRLLRNLSCTMEMLSWLFFGTARTFIGFAKLLFLCTVPVSLVLGPRLGLGVFLLEDSVVAVVVSKLAMAAGAAGCACIGLAAAVVAVGLGVVVAIGRVMGLVRSAIAAVVSELGEPEGLCYPDSDCAEAG